MVWEVCELTGSRTANIRRSGRHLPPKRRNNSSDRTRFRIVVCGIAFCVLVFLKILVPDAVSSLAGAAVNLIGGDADFQEAFAAVGRAVSGDESVRDSLQDVYIAVFHSSVISDSDEASSDVRNSDTSDEVIEQNTDPAQCSTQLLPVPVEPEAENSAQENAGAERDTISTPAADIDYLLNLPENASLEQRDLGFSYVTPVQGKLTSSFGWRSHPTTGENRFHYGIDLAADAGTPIYAFGDAMVYATGESSTLGKYIILLHANGYKSLYAHCSAILVKSGDVTKGEPIAAVGETGTATGPHLHFELQSGSLYLNPIDYVAIG